MSHHIYQTNAFVLDSYGSGEANKTLVLFTEELGLLYAAAQGVRHQKSKLKASIQNLTYARVCLVRGREVWRLTSAQKLISLFDRRLSISLRKTMAAVLQFVNRMSPGEGKQKELFDILTNFCSFCFEKKDILNPTVLDMLYLLAQYKILHALGYGANLEDVPATFVGSEWNESMLQDVMRHEGLMKSHVETALRESHL